jgi:DNA-directed RNA polymerase beta subunit
LLTRQPLKKSKRGDALGLGECEQQALVAHGASLLLKKRSDSDKVCFTYLLKCGAIAMKKYKRKNILSNLFK